MIINGIVRACLAPLFLLFLCQPLQGSQEQEGTIVIRADRMQGEDGFTGGILVVRDGKIMAKGNGIEIPEGAVVYSHDKGTFLTAGLIDAASTAGVTNRACWAEHGSEVTPQLLSYDALDLDDQAFKHLARQGVTAVYVTPDPASVIGARGAVVKTGGPSEKRLVTAEADLKASFGPQAWRRGARNHNPFGRTDILSRRPTTRMGMSYVFRQAFFDALAYREKHEGKDPAMEVLVRVLDGDLRLRIQAREAIDIWSAIRLAREFNLSFVLEEGTEAYQCIPELKTAQVPVIFGPLFVEPSGQRRSSGESLRPCLNAAGLLDESGIVLALTASDLEGEESLPFQAAFAVRCGLPFERALAATTTNPAAILGLSDRLGSLETGRDGDAVLWSGRPFSPLTRPLLVLISGEIVYQDPALLAEGGSETE